MKKNMLTVTQRGGFLALALIFILSLSSFPLPATLAIADSGTTNVLVPVSDGHYKEWQGDFHDVDETSDFNCEDKDSIKGEDDKKSSFVVNINQIPNDSIITSVDIYIRDIGDKDPDGTYKTFVRLNDVDVPADSLLYATDTKHNSCGSEKKQTINVSNILKDSTTTLEIGVEKVKGDKHANRAVRVGVINAIVSYSTPVLDKIPPTVTINIDSKTIEATELDGGATVNFVSNATDDVDGQLIATCNPESGSIFPLGESTIKCSATDLSGNIGEGTTVVNVVDTTPPAIKLNGLETINLVVGDLYTEDGATAVDIVDGNVSVEIGGDIVNTNSPGIFTITYNAKDNSNNAAQQLTRVITVSDVNAPEINVNSNITVEATDKTGAVVTYDDVYGRDDVDEGQILAVCTPVSGSLFPIGETSVTCEARDSAGNIGNGAFSITVQDTTPPTITLIGDSSIEIKLGETYVEFGATAVDNIDGDITNNIITTGSVDVNILGDYTINYDVKDFAGNSAIQLTRLVSVKSSSSPEVPTGNGLISGYKWKDANNSETRDLLEDSIEEMEPGLSGWVINLFNYATDTLIATTTTDENGYYEFSGLQYDTYKVTEDEQSGWYQTFPTDPAYYEITLDIEVPRYETAYFGNNMLTQISEETKSEVSSTNTTITWTTDRPATSRVVWGTESISNASTTEIGGPNYGYTNSTVEDPNLVTEHSVKIDGLVPSTTYYFRPISHASPEVLGSEISVTTANEETNQIQENGATSPGNAVAVGGGSGGGTSPTPSPSPYISTVPQTTNIFAFTQNNTGGGTGENIEEGIGATESGVTGNSESTTPQPTETGNSLGANILETSQGNEENQGNLSANILSILGGESIWWVLLIIILMALGYFGYSSYKKGKQQ